MKLKAMSFNIQHCRNYNFRPKDIIDFDVMADTIAKMGADICGLNEVRALGEDTEWFQEQAKEIADRLGMNYCFAPAINIKGRGPYGNAFISKYPILQCENIPIPDPAPEEKVEGRWYETRCLLKAVIDFMGRPVTIFVTHFGLSPEEAMNASETIVKNVSKVSTPRILMGDFNLTPESPILDPIRIILADTADVFNEPKLSFPSDDPKIKIDYMFVSDDIKIVNADIPAIIASDHRPYVATLDIDV